MNTLIDINGTPHKHSNEENPPLSLDKIVAKQTFVSYFVLVSSNGQLFNPLEAGNNIMKRDTIGRSRYYQLKKCGKSCYSSYVEFLRSKNRTHFILAQRRFISAT